jgi:hypothetical protein
MGPSPVPCGTLMMISSSSPVPMSGKTTSSGNGNACHDIARRRVRRPLPASPSHCSALAPAGASRCTPCWKSWDTPRLKRAQADSSLMALTPADSSTAVGGRYDVDGAWLVRAFHRYSCTNSLGETSRSTASALIWSLMASRIHTFQRTALPCGYGGSAVICTGVYTGG